MFSVIMPVWNRADWVERALKSVLAQTCPDVELIIVDDGSEDDPLEVVEPYLCESVQLHSIPHSGLSAARNAGINIARHPLIAYLDSDNVWDRHFLEKMLVPLEKHELAYCRAIKMYRDPSTGKLRFRGTIGEPFSMTKLLHGNFIDINTFVHSRKALEYSGGFDVDLRRLEDWDFIIRMTSYFEPAYVQDVLVNYSVNLARNALSLVEDLEKADAHVRAKHASLKQPVTFEHDTVKYVFDGLSEKKYRNWVCLQHSQLNVTDYTAWGYPFFLQIEPSNACNLKCTLCPVAAGELGRGARNMKLGEFQGIVDDLQDYLMLLVLWDWGEPFMNKALPEMIRYAAEREIRTVTSTNAHFLDDDDYVERILTSGLSTLIIAIDSMQPDSYEHYRRKGSLNRALTGLERTVAMKKKLSSPTLIHMRTVAMRHNEPELPRLEALAGEIGVDRFSVKAVTPGYREPDPAQDREHVPRNLSYRFFEYKPGTYERIRENFACRRPWETSSILSNGDVVPCCWDYDDSMKVGNVFEKPFSEIWKGAEYKALRKKVMRERHTLPKCTICPPNFKLSEGGWFPRVVDFTPRR